MTAVQNPTENQYPELVYHIKRTISKLPEADAGTTRSTEIIGTFTDLKAAKDAARTALFGEGYLKNDFQTYETNEDGTAWKYGGGVIVVATAETGVEFEVSLETKPNGLGFVGNSAGEVEGDLYYVLQTKTDYNTDRSDGIQTTEIEGTFRARQSAVETAKAVLLDADVTKKSFAEYDEQEAFKGEWPYGSDVVVHAVEDTGENFTVAVKTRLSRAPREKELK